MLRIASADRAALRAHLAAAYPREGCGILLGSERHGERRVREVVAVENAHQGSRRDRYEIDPARLLEVEKRARERGLAVIGFYHSHPDAAPEPSRFDRERAWPCYSYVIVRVDAAGAKEIRSWRLRDERGDFEPEALGVQEP